MQLIEITENGTSVFELRAGVFRIDIEGTLDSGLAIALKAGGAADGSDHVAVPDKDGLDFIFTGSAGRAPELIQGAGFYSLVTTGFGSSASVKVSLRRSDVH